MEFVDENHVFTFENTALLLATNVRLSDQVTSLQQHLETAEKKLAWLSEQAILNKQKRFAAQNEASKYLQLSFDEMDDVEAPKPEEPTTETITYTRQKKSVGRKIDTSNLPREVVVHDLAATEKCCKQCGKQLEKFGEDRSEQLGYIPAQINVVEHVCPKYTCRSCETVVSAAKPEMPLSKSMAAPSLIAEVIIKKYEHHLPWHRQAKIFAQDGIVPRPSTRHGATSLVFL